MSKQDFRREISKMIRTFIMSRTDNPQPEHFQKCWSKLKKAAGVSGPVSKMSIDDLHTLHYITYRDISR